MRFLAILVALLTLIFNGCAVVLALPANNTDSIQKAQRRQTTISNSNGYLLRWSTTNTRLKYGSKAANWIAGYSLPTTSTTLTQSIADKCTSYCNTTPQCITAYVIQYSGKDGFSCQMYNLLQRKSDATYTTGYMGDTSQKILGTWAYRKDDTTSTTTSTTAKPSTSTTSTTAKTSSTTTTAKPTSTTSTKVTSTTTKPTSTATTSSATTAKTSSTTTAKTSTTTTTAQMSTITTARTFSTTTTAQTSTITTAKTSTTATVTTSTSTTKPTSTTSGYGPKTTNTFPAPPSGATFHEYLPTKCSGTKGTVPLFANKLWSDPNSKSDASAATTAYVVIHGASRNFQDAYSQLGSNINQQSAVLVAPNFYITDDTPTVSKGAQSNWYIPNGNLAWAGYREWSGGSDASGPASGAFAAGTCSTFDVMDSLVEMLNDKSRYPRLQKIYLVGHSAGSSFLHHYAPLVNSALSSSTSVTYVAMNAAALVYYNNVRPSIIGSDCTSTYNDWVYGVGSGLPRYVSSRGGTNAASAFRRWLQQDFRTGNGLLDTYASYTFGDQTCAVKAQGGVNRRDRNYAMWAYKNILAGTGTDVSNYFGYRQFKNMQPLGNAGFNHQYCNVPQAGHVDSQMYGSACGQYYLGQSSTPPPNAPPGPTVDSETTPAPYSDKL
ncbi:unnamed protein product [Sympodiomycopsis kandeliae]